MTKDDITSFYAAYREHCEKSGCRLMSFTEWLIAVLELITSAQSLLGMDDKR